MAQDAEAMQEKPPNACCAALKDKNAKLLEMCKIHRDLKNKFRQCTDFVRMKYDVIEKENESLKIALEEVLLQASLWKDEKEQEAGHRIDLEDVVSALEDEVLSLKQNGNSTSEVAKKQLQERLVVAEKGIEQLIVLLGQERGRVALEKKKADEALKKVEVEKNKVSEEGKVAKAERIKAEENRVLMEKLKRETDDLKSMLALEKSKTEAAEKKVDAEKQNAMREKTRADSAIAKCEEQWEFAEVNLKIATFEKDRADDLNRKLEQARNKAEAAEKKVEAEKQRAIRERADMAVAISEDQLKLAETKMEMAMFEKDQKVMELMKLAEEHKRMAMEQKSRADHLSRELENYKLKFEESQKELQEFISCRIGSNVPPRNNDVASETNTVKLLKKQLKLEKMLVKHAKEATKLEAFRNKILRQELSHLTRECGQFQQHLDILNKRFLLGGEHIDKMEKSCRVSRKPSIVHRILNSQKDNPNSKNLKETSCRELSRPCKKRKTPEGLNTNGPSDCMPASSPGPDLRKLRRLSDQEFDDIVGHDHMKLLDLDNAADEDSYRRAVAMPLSPALPVVDFLEADNNSEMLVRRSLQEGLSNVQDNPTSVSRCHVIESEKDSNQGRKQLKICSLTGKMVQQQVPATSQQSTHYPHRIIRIPLGQRVSTC